MSKFRKSKSLAELSKEVHKHFTFSDYQLSSFLDAKKHAHLQLDEKLGTFIADNVRGLSSTQLRKIYDDIVNPSNNSVATIQMLRPQFAYIITRQPNESAKKIMLFADELAKETYREEDIEFFKSTMQKVVACHRFYEVLSKRRLDYEKDLISANEKLLNILSTLSNDKLNNINLELEKIEKYIQSIPKNRNIKPTQLRRLYDAVNNANTPTEIKNLLPIISYTAARQESKESIQLIVLILELCKKAVAENLQLVHLKKVLEIIVSFHSYYYEYKESPKTNYDIDIPKLLNDDVLRFEWKQNFIKGLFENKETLKSINSHQLRKLFDETRTATSIEEIQLNRPLFLYATGRKQNKLFLLLNNVIRKIEKGQLEVFQSLLEDIVAYHKYYEVTK